MNFGISLTHDPEKDNLKDQIADQLGEPLENKELQKFIEDTLQSFVDEFSPESYVYLASSGSDQEDTIVTFSYRSPRYPVPQAPEVEIPQPTIHSEPEDVTAAAKKEDIKAPEVSKKP